MRYLKHTAVSALVSCLASTVFGQEPIAWYSFDITGDVGHDSAGSKNGTPVNVTQVPGITGIRGQAASFQNGYIGLPSAPLFNLRSGDFTLSVFVKGTPGNNIGTRLTESND